MLFLVVTLLICLAVAALVVGYVAYPYNGRDLPGAPKLGRWMRRQVDELPALEEEDVPLGHH